MNALESAGIRVFRKIAFEAQTMKNVKLSRKELITLRFYSLLTSARTPKLRENIKVELVIHSLINLWKKMEEIPRIYKRKKLF